MAKLVRDRIIEIMQDQGKTPVFHTANDDEYFEKLKEKLGEEVREFQESENPEELADIVEVIKAICDQRGITFEEIEQLRVEKVERNGSFTKKLILNS